MTEIQNVDSCPKYISAFISHNLDDLCTIYDEGLDLNPGLENGILVLACSENNNKMEVQFMNDEMMCEIIVKESVMNLKSNIQEGKKLLFVRDEDHNAIFLIQV
jgi:hypothetical protein